MEQLFTSNLFPNSSGVGWGGEERGGGEESGRLKGEARGCWVLLRWLPEAPGASLSFAASLLYSLGQAPSLLRPQFPHVRGNG